NAVRASATSANASQARRRSVYGRDFETRYQWPRFMAQTTTPKSSAPRTRPAASHGVPSAAREARGSTRTREVRTARDARTERKRKKERDKDKDFLEGKRGEAPPMRARSVAATAPPKAT